LLFHLALEAQVAHRLADLQLAQSPDDAPAEDHGHHE
jgi:hypothetical protein